MKRRQISIPEEIDEHLEKQTNASGYIVQLIRADISNKKPLTREEVEKIIQDYVKSNPIETKNALMVDDQDESSVNSFLSL